MVKALQALEEIGLTLREMLLLASACEQPGLSVRDIAKASKITRASVVRATDSLVEKGYLTKVRIKQDARLVNISPTALGRRTCGRIEKALAS